jgi:agmatine deiminase
MGPLLPAEWEEHEATWLAWPYDPITFPDRVARVEDRYVEIACALLEGERVELLVRDEETRKRVLARIRDAGGDAAKLRTHLIDYADVWIRDYGPLFVRDRASGALSISKWRFNAWGGKYEGHLRDDRIVKLLNADLRFEIREAGRTLEGGSIDGNGRGTLLTTEQCLLNPNRNGRVTKSEVERWLLENLGGSHVIWLGEGIEGDDTDGHVDDLARFVSPTTVVCAVGGPEEGHDRKVLEENFDRLGQARDQDGRPLKLVKLPMPRFVGDTEGRLPASYANFYIANRVVLVPIFGHPTDAEALRIIGAQFPGRRTVGIRCEDMVYGLGTLHCATMQQPRGHPAVRGVM